MRDNEAYLYDMLVIYMRVRGHNESYQTKTSGKEKDDRLACTKIGGF